MGYTPPLTADVTTVLGSPATTLVGTANTESIIRANTLDQMGAPAANVSMNSKRLTTAGAGIVSTDYPDLAQLVGLQYPYVVSGCVWTADAAGSTLLASMTSGTVMIKGILLTVAAVTSRTFTASVDTYIDLADNGDGTAAINYTTAANNATSPALASSGTVLNTIRLGWITSGGSSIPSTGVYQGNPSATLPPTSIATTTVAAGSNGNAITTATLSVAANSLPAAGVITVAHSQETYTLKYTSGGGTTTLSGVTVLGGVLAHTVATSDVVTSVVLSTVTDSLGNLLYNTSPKPTLLGYAQTSAVYTTTNTVTQSWPALICPVIIPAGPARQVKLVGHGSYLQSSAIAGTAVNLLISNGNGAVGANAIATSSFKVAVTSDGNALHCEGVTTLAAGTYSITAGVSQGAAGTLTLGESLVNSAIWAELLN